LPRKPSIPDGLRLKICIAVHGRFHAFDLARELIRCGHDVTLFTNYPAFAAARFGIPRDSVRSYSAHGIATRIASRLVSSRFDGWLEKIANQAFGRWAASCILAEDWDVVIAFSGIAEEVFVGLAGRSTLRVLQRGSAHIEVERRILQEEQARTGQTIEVPSDWIVERERREYALADVIHVLSEFAEETFIDEGVPQRKLFRLNLGVDLARFRASEDVVENRVRRILAGEPIRVLNVGTFSHRKGARDWADVVKLLPSNRFQVRFVGPVAKDGRKVARALAGSAEFCSKRPQHDLPAEYAWGDIFLLLTLEDGFAVVLTQALAAGVPLITTPNCAGPELVSEGHNGWVIPIRSATSVVERLMWLDRNRDRLASAVRAARITSEQCGWSNTADQVERNLEIGSKMKASSGLRIASER
jgi:glycosyltransferase involved in cell wall biosynthesis